MPKKGKNEIDTKPYQPPAVDVEEMAFAIALFAAAVRGRIVSPNTGFMAFTAQEKRLLQLDPILLGARAVLPDESAGAFDEVLLARAVGVVWHHYEQDLRRQALCSRLIAFYSLVVRGRGGWAKAVKTESASNLSTMALSAATVAAVATAAVGGDGQFYEAEFDSFLNGSAKRDGQPAELEVIPYRRETRRRAYEAPLSVTGAVQQLSVQLFAFQLCIAPDPEQAIPQFRVVERLCVGVAAVSGHATLRGMLSRALRATLPDFPWLQSEQPLSARFLTGLHGIPPAPTDQEAVQCEIAIVGALIELLRAMLGDVVTIQLLRSVWPFASLDAGERARVQPGKVRPLGDLPQQTDRTQ